MNPAVSLIVALIVCASILLVQTSGLHLHANAGGVAGLHGTHLHHADPDGHDHSGDRDVEFYELASGFAKLVAFLPPLVLLLLALVLSSRPVRIALQSCWLPRHHVRWLPPLRAPPPILS